MYNILNLNVSSTFYQFLTHKIFLFFHFFFMIFFINILCRHLFIFVVKNTWFLVDITLYLYYFFIFFIFFIYYFYFMHNTLIIFLFIFLYFFINPHFFLFIFYQYFMSTPFYKLFLFYMKNYRYNIVSISFFYFFIHF